MKGDFKVEFPSHVDNIGAKISKLAEEPICYQLYKRGDLIGKAENTVKDWDAAFTRKHLIGIIANEAANKADLKLRLAIRAKYEFDCSDD